MFRRKQRQKIERREVVTGIHPRLQQSNELSFTGNVKSNIIQANCSLLVEEYGHRMTSYFLPVFQIIKSEKCLLSVWKVSIQRQRRAARSWGGCLYKRPLLGTLLRVETGRTSLLRLLNDFWFCFYEAGDSSDHRCVTFRAEFYFNLMPHWK